MLKLLDKIKEIKKLKAKKRTTWHNFGISVSGSILHPSLATPS